MLKKNGKRWLGLLLSVVMLIPGNLTAVVSAEGGSPTGDETISLVQAADRRDFSIPTNERHAYSPFARLESEEATETYRAQAEVSDGTIIYKQTETTGLFRKTPRPETDVDALAEIGIEVANAKELNRREVDSGWFTSSYEVTYQATLNGDVWKAVDSLSNMDGIVDAQPEYIYRNTSIGVPDVTTDEDLGQQWYVNQLHLSPIWQDFDANGLIPGMDTIVAVIDTGVDYTHPDLMSNMWVNAAELNGLPGVDDDGNGYVDDIYGCSTVGATYYHTGDPMDDHGHGTHVAGIIAMAANNQVGGAGVAYGTKIMAIKAGQATGTFADADIAEAIRYAAANGADVINMSFGGYGHSFLIEDALQDAFGTCVLVAAAGNDGIPTSDAPVEFLKKADTYPAAYSYVLGVMATDQSGALAGFSNWDYYDNGGSGEYELTAPGVEIFSTLPGGQYAKWSGTSMAAPIVSASAALLRTKYFDKSLYSSRFIMGQLSSATEDTTAYIDMTMRPHTYAALNIEDSLTKLPRPNLTVKSSYLFDSADIAAGNDGDGIVDAGETIDLGLVLRNQWGLATNVTVTADAKSIAGVDNPYVEFLTDSITMADVGTFNEQDNCFRYDGDYLAGTDNPIRFKIKADTINDANIAINLHVTAKNGLDSKDTADYAFDTTITFFVQRGRVLKGKVTEDMTLTKEDYWIIENSLYIPAGVTVTVEPGTQVQFWSSDPEDPYADKAMAYIQVDGALYVNGTQDEPVEMFPSIAFQDYGVDIRGGVDTFYGAAHPASKTQGTTVLQYANILNPILNINEGSHLSLVQNPDDVLTRTIDGMTIYEEYNRTLVVQRLIDSTVRGLRNSQLTLGYSEFYGTARRVLFDSCALLSRGITACYDSPNQFEDCAFVGNVANLRRGDTAISMITNPSDYFSDVPYSFSAIDAADGRKRVRLQYRNHPVTYGYRFPITASQSVQTSIGHEDIYLYSIVSQLFEALAAQRGGISVSCDFSAATVLLEYPDTVPDEVITAPYTIDDYRAALPDWQADDFTHNAILNRLLNPNTDTWMHIAGVANGGNVNNHYAFSAANNYWGTEDERLIQKQITDFDDYTQLPDILHTPWLTLDSPELGDIYPFVTEAYLTDMDGNRVETVGFQTVQVHVTFNRDMDSDIQPMVSYGSAEPYTDHSVNGDWVDARHWVGVTSIKPLIDAGTEYIRVKGGAAADDNWLVTGTDWGRFAFTISNTGVQAMNLQGEGLENKVRLTWNQNDYDTLAGYNVYRADREDGEFVKINTRLVPSTIREFTDTNVEPGRDYYYSFTVVGTDMAESKPSNIVKATPLDNIRPVLEHTRVTQSKYGEAIPLSVVATDNIGVEYVKIYYRAKGAEGWKNLNLTAGEGDRYFGVIPAAEVARDGMEYYIEVSDGTSVARDGSEQMPIRIAIDNTAVIYSVSPAYVDVAKVADGVTGTIVGVNFTADMTLTIGGKPVNFAFDSDKQLTFTVPSGSIGRVDVVLTRGKGDSKETARLTNAITYEDKTGEVQVIGGDLKARETVRLPIYAKAGGDLFGVDMQFRLNRDLFSNVAFEKAENTAGAIADYYMDYSGKLTVSMSSPNALPRDGKIGCLVLTAKDLAATTTTTVQLVSAFLNDVEVPSLIDGSVTIVPNFTVGGQVTYYKGGAPIAGVTVRLSNGMSAVTDANGRYEITGVTSGNVLVTAELNGKVNGAISAQDASLVLQAIVGKVTLDETQRIAADVTGDGELTAMDATYILQKTVGILTDEYPGSGAEWVFTPSVQNLTLTGDNTNLNFTAVLLGDVTGDWQASGTGDLS